MGTKQVKTSDLSGIDLDENEVVVVTVKDAGKKFDCSLEEIKLFKPVTNVIELEVVYPGQTEKKTVLVSRTEFEKQVPKDKLAGFPSNRGRAPGFSPKLHRSSTNGSASE